VHAHGKWEVGVGEVEETVRRDDIKKGGLGGHVDGKAAGTQVEKGVQPEDFSLLHRNNSSTIATQTNGPLSDCIYSLIKISFCDYTVVFL